MELRGAPPNHVPGAVHSPPSDQGAVKTEEGLREVKPLTTLSKYAIGALVVVGVAGAAIAVLRLTNVFSPAGSIGFYAPITFGGGTAVLATAGIIGIAIANCGRTQAAQVEINADEKPLAYSELGQSAIDFAREQLQNHPLQPTPTSQLIDPEVTKLVTLYFKKYEVSFEQACAKYQDDPWSNQEVIQAADELMKIGFAISCLHFDDFSRPFITNKLNITLTDALKAAYESLRNMKLCAYSYSLVTGKIEVDEGHENTFENDFKPPPAPEWHLALFHQEKTIQSRWSHLYAEFCDRILAYNKRNPINPTS